MSNATSDAHAARTHTQVWFVDVSECADVLHTWQDQSHALDEATVARLKRIRDDADRTTRFTVHCALRVLIEREKGPSWRGKPLMYSDHGQPALPGLDLAFSLSHTNGAGLVALSPGRCVGVDIEPVGRPIKMRSERQQAILSAAEALSPSTRPLSGARLAFLSAWVRLEAYGKATGRGLAPLLTEAMAPLRQNNAPLRQAEIEARRDSLSVFDLEVAPNFVAAIALDDAGLPPIVSNFPNTAQGLEALGLS